MKTLTLTTLALATAAWIGPSSQAAIVNSTYTAEGLTTAASIVAPQQDGWFVYSGSGDANAETVTHPTEGSTTVIRQVTSGVQLARVNDLNFDYLPHSGSNTAAEMVFDAHYVATSDLVFGLGDDLGINTNSRLGPVFGFSGSNYFIREAVFGANSTSARPAGDDVGDWYRIKLTVDFTGFSGDGSGDMYVMNLTDGETDFRPTPIFSNFNLGILSMAAASQDPANWNSIYVRLGAGNEADNLNPNFVVPPVPEPSSLFLLGLGVLGWVRFTQRGRRKQVGTARVS